jgi:hypothetical protein
MNRHHRSTFIAQDRADIHGGTPQPLQAAVWTICRSLATETV